MTAPTPLYTAWGRDDDGFDIDGDGAPGVGMAANAIAVWSVLQNRERVTVGETAAAFNIPPKMAADAVLNGYWMALEDASGTIAFDVLPSITDAELSAFVIIHEGE